ncbi:MAG: energy transducer TonB, partial [Bacteroidales bacterium]|nr:energy transducer TonB [Bacteroidales bacterium]
VDIIDYIEEVKDEEVDEEAIPFAVVEEKPMCNGGDANEFTRWVNSKLVYPEIPKENGVQGRVTLQFTVEKDGSVTNVKVLRGVDPSLDKEAVRVVQSSPKWTPGKQRDRAVKVTYTFPVIFQLR